MVALIHWTRPRVSLTSGGLKLPCDQGPTLSEAVHNLDEKGCFRHSALFCHFPRIRSAGGDASLTA